MYSARSHSQKSVVCTEIIAYPLHIYSKIKQEAFSDRQDLEKEADIQLYNVDLKYSAKLNDRQ